MLEITLPDADSFLKIRETLTRIGIGNSKTKTLFQSVHILHKRGRYYIVHFKELYALDGRETSFCKEDENRRTAIAILLEDWNLCKLVKPINEPERSNFLKMIKKTKIIPFSESAKWTLLPKYKIGKNKK